MYGHWTTSDLDTSCGCCGCDVDEEDPIFLVDDGEVVCKDCADVFYVEGE